MLLKVGENGVVQFLFGLAMVGLKISARGFGFARGVHGGNCCKNVKHKAELQGETGTNRMQRAKLVVALDGMENEPKHPQGSPRSPI